MALDYNFTLLMLIFLRMSGCILFNPIFGRRNLPNPVKIGLTLMLTLFAYRLTPAQDPGVHTFPALFFCGLKEMLVGYIVGYVMKVLL